MFKSIQWKVLTVFILLIVSVMIVVGTFLLNSINEYYHKEFTSQMESLVFVDDLISQLSEAAVYDDAVPRITGLLDVYGGRIGTDAYRNYYILNGKTAFLHYGSDGSKNQSFSITSNILSAMQGNIGNQVDRRGATMNYAYPVASGNSVKYIIYITDTKEELKGIMNNIFAIILWALLLGLFISVFLGLFLSKTIIAPISSLKRSAQRIASGDFAHKIDVMSRDEIGDLTRTFNAMATELEDTLYAMDKEKSKMETIFLYMTDGIMAFSHIGEILHINPAAKIMLDLNDDTINFDDFFKTLGVEIKLEDLLYLENYKTIERTISNEGKHIKAFFAPFMSEEGKPDGVVVVFQDITEQEKLDAARREFVANVSHELRTPLTTVKSYAETLMENVPRASMEYNFLDVINTESNRMARIVTDLLTLSRLDYDKTALNKTSFSLTALTEDIVHKLSIDAKRHNHKLTVTGSEEIPPFFGDRDRLEQVITNIVSNAIKYTPDGGSVTVDCNYRYTNVIITVTDTGIGIPPSDISRIFERFYRVDKARSRKYGGTGLGLAIAKEIVEAHGGKIEIKSALRKGTTVTITMPVYSK